MQLSEMNHLDKIERVEKLCSSSANWENPLNDAIGHTLAYTFIVKPTQKQHIPRQLMLRFLKHF